MIEIKGNLIDLKSVVKEDARFILELRQNLELNKFISSTSTNLDDQIIWIENYLKREIKKEEVYFIVKTKENNSCGTVRIYKIDNEKNECVWGSFILNRDRPDGAAYEVINLSLNYAFEVLKIKKILLDVHKENKKAIHIYEKFGFKKYYEDNINYYYKKNKEENK